MWRTKTEMVHNGHVQKLGVFSDTQAMSFSDVVDGWEGDEGFRAFFNQRVADVPFAAFFWEMPAITRSLLHQPFECVFVDSPALAGVKPDDQAFAEYFLAAECEDGVVAFTNLGRDAFLLAPCPLGEPVLYSHIAAFVRGAPAVQQQALWRCLGAALRQHLSAKPLWVSTSGLGVYWLHVRLDGFPKYYTYGSYAQFPWCGIQSGKRLGRK